MLFEQKILLASFLRPEYAVSSRSTLGFCYVDLLALQAGFVDDSMCDGNFRSSYTTGTSVVTLEDKGAREQ